MKTILTIITLFISTSLFAQEGLIVSRVDLQERQNSTAKQLPKLLLEAYSKGDIKAYYPKDLRLIAPYTQFLNHFGMINRAAAVIINQQPSWFCRKAKPVKIDPQIIKCMQYTFELGERSYRNNITYQQEKRIEYVKLIYSHECTADGIEKEGPVFKMSDMEYLRQSEYALINYENTAVTYAVSDFLKLRLFGAK